MSQYLDQEFESWIGRTLKDEAGHKVGKVDDIYTDDDTGQPEWLAVTTGHFGSNMSFVPVAGATPTGDHELQVQFPREQVKDAPNAGSDGILSPDEEARLYAHYGYDYDQERVRLQRWVDQDRAAVPGMAESGRDPQPSTEPTLDPRDDDRRLTQEGLDTTSRPSTRRAWEDDEPDQGRTLADRRPDQEPTLADRRPDRGPALTDRRPDPLPQRGL